MQYSDYTIFVDESGDHNLETSDQVYPVFVLSFCVFSKHNYVNDVIPRVTEFKFKYFGHNMEILHERHIRKQEPPFAFLKFKTNYDKFMNDLNKLINNFQFTIISSVIDKKHYAEKYHNPHNPYDLAFLFCMERAYYFLSSLGQQNRITHIVVERRGKREDSDLRQAFDRIRKGDRGNQPMPNFELVFADKKANSSGLQLADLTARPIGRHVMDPGQPNRAWDIVERKLYSGPMGQTMGWGLKVFP